MLKFNYKKLKEARKLKDYTLQDMADRLQIDLHSYWKIEQGKTSLKVNHLFRILAILDKPLEYFTENNSTIDDIYIKIKDVEALLDDINTSQITDEHKEKIMTLRTIINNFKQ